MDSLSGSSNSPANSFGDLEFQEWVEERTPRSPSPTAPTLEDLEEEAPANLQLLSGSDTSQFLQAAAPNRPFLLETTQWFFTFPRCEAPKQQLAAALEGWFAAKERSIKWALICQEHHQDGTPHLHAAVVIDKRFKVRNPRAFDALLPGYHPCVQHMRNVHRAANYVRKQDAQVLSIGTPPSGKAHTKTQVGL